MAKKISEIDLTAGIKKLFGKDKTGMGGFFEQAFSSIKSSIGDAIKTWMEWNDAVFGTARAIGMTREQAQGLTDALMKDTAELSRLYGLSQKEINDFQEGIVKNTGRAIVLTREQNENLAVLRNMMGGSGSTETMQIVSAFQELGIGIGDTLAHVALLQEKAAEFGLSAQEASSALAKNMELAQSVTFKHGIDGLSTMLLKAKQLRADIQSIVKASEGFTDIEKAIKNTASIQMLGGNFGASFSNPMAVMADALMNQEAFGERIFKAIEGKATWDSQRGEARIAPVDLQLLKTFAESVGMDSKEVIKMARASAQNAAVDQRLSLNARANQFSSTQQQWLRANAQWDSTRQTFVVAGIDEFGNRREEAVEDISPEMLATMQSSALSEENMMANVAEINENVRELAKKTGRTRAQRLVSTNQNIKGMQNAFKVSAVRIVNPLGNKISNYVNSDSKLGVTVDKIAANPYTAGIASFGTKAVSDLISDGNWKGALANSALAVGALAGAATMSGKDIKSMASEVTGALKDLATSLTSTTDHMNALTEYMGSTIKERGRVIAGKDVGVNNAKANKKREDIEETQNKNRRARGKKSAKTTVTEKSVNTETVSTTKKAETIVINATTPVATTPTETAVPIKSQSPTSNNIATLVVEKPQTTNVVPAQTGEKPTVIYEKVGGQQGGNAQWNGPNEIIHKFVFEDNTLTLDARGLPNGKLENVNVDNLVKMVIAKLQTIDWNTGRNNGNESFG